MTNSTGGKFRHRRVNFSAVSNLALQDSRLSLKAKGLYSIIQSYIDKPNYDLHKYVLISLCKEGQKAFDAAWKELKDTGYLKIYRRPSGLNDKFEYEYELLDEADQSIPAFINLSKNGDVIAPKEQKAENPEFPHPPKKEVCENAKEQSNPKSSPKDSNSHTPHFVPYAKSTICEQHPMPNGGDIRNTESRNTDLRYIDLSIRPSDRPTDFLREKLKRQIEYDYFEENEPEEIGGIDCLVDCMVEMLTRPSTKINGSHQSREALESCLSRVDSCTVREFLEHMKDQNLSGIKNLFGYYQTSLINYLREQEFRLLNA